MKTRSFFSVLAAIVLALLLAGGAGAYWLDSNNPDRLMQGVEQSTPAASQFVSRQSPLVVSLLVNPDRIAALGLASSSPQQRKAVQTQWQQFRQKLLNQNGLNYQRDIQPWLGDEITFAVTTSDFDRNPSNGQQTGYLIAAAIQHPAQAKQAIQSYWQKQATTGVNLVFEQFAGINLIYGSRNRTEDWGLGTEDQSEEKLVGVSALTTAIVGDRFVLFSNHPKVMRDAINNLQVPDLSLSSSTEYQQALQRLSKPHVGAVFVHLPQLAAWLEPDSVALPPTAASPTFESLIMAIQLDPQGVIGDGLVLAAADRSIETTKPDLTEPVQALQYLPAASALALSGKDLPQLWTQLNREVAGYEGLEALIRKPLNLLQQRWQAEPATLFGWVQGEYALGRLPRPNSALSDWVLVAERSPTATEDIAQLDAMAQARGISVSPFTVAAHPVTAWTKLSTASVNPARSGHRPSITVQATVEAVHTTIDRYELFATSLDAIAEAIQASENSSEHSLLNAEKFQQAVSPLPLPNGGYFYADATILRSFLEQQLTDSPAAFLRPFLEDLRSITVSRYGSELNAARQVLFFRL